MDACGDDVLFDDLPDDVDVVGVGDFAGEERVAVKVVGAVAGDVLDGGADVVVADGGVEG